MNKVKEKQRLFVIDKCKSSLGIDNVYLCERTLLVDRLCEQLDTNTALLVELYKVEPDHSIFESFTERQMKILELAIANR